MNNSSVSLRFFSYEDIERMLDGNYSEMINVMETAFKIREKGRVLLPEKISQIFNEQTQERINCMPATLLDEKVCGMKWVSVFPTNTKKGLPNVNGAILLSEIENGTPIAFMDGTLCTKVRTAAVGGLAARYLAKKNTESVGFIGAGEQAKFHFIMLKSEYPNITRCYVSSHTSKRELEFVDYFKEDYKDVEFIVCDTDYQKAVKDADIIVTATSTQAPLLKEAWIKEGALYIHVGGWEDEYKVVDKADKIICDDWQEVKHRSQTISRMYFEGLLHDENIYADIIELINGKKPGRTTDSEFIYFNSVGLAFLDIYFAYVMYVKGINMDLGQEIRLA